VNLQRFLPAALVSTIFIVSQSASAAVSTTHLDAPARRNPEASLHADGPRDARNARRGMGRAAAPPANSDRVRTLLNRQARGSQTASGPAARGHIAAPPTTAGESTSGYPSRAPRNPGPGAANSSQGHANLSASPAPAAPNLTPRRAAAALSQNPAAGKTGAIGGPRAQGYPRLGGAVSGKAVHPAVLDGSQLRRKY
jgi:hypothetical protein